MELQSANAVLLVRPAAFGFNPEAAQSNVFAQASSDPELERKALAEFDTLAERLSDSGVEVVVLNDTPDPPQPPEPARRRSRRRYPRWRCGE